MREILFGLRLQEEHGLTEFDTTGPIAFAACLQTDLSTPNFVIQEMSLGMHYNVEAGDIDLTTYIKDKSVFSIKDGYVAAPTGPGLGIEIDEDLVRKIAAETQPW